MRLTVGPLPPAVYWRRRAIVLGVLALAVSVVVFSCGTSKSSVKEPADLRSRASAVPSWGTGETVGPVVTADPTSSASASADVTSAPASGECADAEISVMPSTAGNKTQLARGEAITLYLRIRNVGTRTCSRDVGADQQELRISQGAQVLWSSDQCGGAKGSSVQPLPPGEQLEFNVLWNGRASTNCQTRPLPNPGTYQLYARVGTKASPPVTLTIA
ncbi:MAG TPA: hypothetical protein VFM37_11775 [Pseudonocardiaceae bacterium]|nr:hypothetical protein [Pseudonocardiaceae bacterium]